MLTAAGIHPIQDICDATLYRLLPHAQQPDGTPGQRRRADVFLAGKPGQPLEALMPEPDTQQPAR
jgi:hypothetical protein